MASTPSSGSCRACEEGKPLLWEGSLRAATAHFWMLQVSREAGTEFSPAGSVGFKGPFPSSGDLPNPGMEPVSPALQADSLPLSHQGSTMLFNLRVNWDEKQNKKIEISKDLSLLFSH